MKYAIAEKLSKGQATISDFENGKIEIGILTLVQIAIVFENLFRTLYLT